MRLRFRVRWIAHLPLALLQRMWPWFDGCTESFEDTQWDHVVLAYHRDKVVGFVAFSELRASGNIDFAHATDPQHRRRGITRRLLTEFVRRYGYRFKLRCDSLRPFMWPQYERRGFTIARYISGKKHYGCRQQGVRTYMREATAWGWPPAVRGRGVKRAA